MDTIETEGIVLQTINFRDYDLIATVFTPDTGLIKVIVFHGNHPKKGMKISALNRVELVYSRGRGDLLKCIEVRVMDQFPHLREKFEYLQAAGQMMQALILSHYPEKPALQLYQLLINFLEKLPIAVDPTPISTSFSLKLMRHEGLFGWNSECSTCQEVLKERIVYRGECFCLQHGPTGAVFFNERDAQNVERLAFSRNIQELAVIPVSEELSEKVRRILLETFEQ